MTYEAISERMVSSVDDEIGHELHDELYYKSRDKSKSSYRGTGCVWFSRATLYHLLNIKPFMEEVQRYSPVYTSKYITVGEDFEDDFYDFVLLKGVKDGYNYI